MTTSPNAAHRTDRQPPLGSIASAGIQPDDDFVAALRAICETSPTMPTVAEASRDWWPLAMHWSLDGEVPQRADVVCDRPPPSRSPRCARRAASPRVPLTAAGGRSGVSGASIPAFGGVVLDLTAMPGIMSIDAASGVVEVWAGTFGPDLETRCSRANTA